MTSKAYTGVPGDMETPADKSIPANYMLLSNEDLRGLLCLRLPDTTFLPVTDETRQTIIAMLEITENDE